MWQHIIQVMNKAYEFNNVWLLVAAWLMCNSVLLWHFNNQANIQANNLLNGQLNNKQISWNVAVCGQQNKTYNVRP
jgi:hypothetical protein